MLPLFRHCARVGLEVDVPDSLAGQMGVELRCGDVRVAEHLLYGAQVAAAGQQVGGEGVPQGVRAHPTLQAHLLRVPADDLVEPLPGQRAAAKVEKQLRPWARADQLRATGPKVSPDRGGRLSAERDGALLVALPVRA